MSFGSEFQMLGATALNTRWTVWAEHDSNGVT